jgi:hypothetical protein
MTGVASTILLFNPFRGSNFLDTLEARQEGSNASAFLFHATGTVEYHKMNVIILVICIGCIFLGQFFYGFFLTRNELHLYSFHQVTSTLLACVGFCLH